MDPLLDLDRIYNLVREEEHHKHYMIDRESKSKVAAALAINWNILVELVNVSYVPTVARQDTRSLGVTRLSACLLYTSPSPRD